MYKPGSILTCAVCEQFEAEQMIVSTSCNCSAACSHDGKACYCNSKQQQLQLELEQQDVSLIMNF